ncbi:MAG TPA: metallophosphoesterase [Clostridia bacterium]|nr:metallophosphoesterase [Clostridia bacterium]
MSKNKTTAGIILLVLAIAFIGIFIVSNQFLTVTTYNLEYPDLPVSFDGFRIVQLSDLHNNRFGADNQRLISAINKQSPDIIVMTGDMINSTDRDYSILISLAENLANKYGTYFVVGNHEQSLKDAELQALYGELKTAGVYILDNEKTTIEKDNERINIYGMWFNLRYYSDQTNQYIRDNPEDYYFSLDRMNSVIGTHDDGFSILLTHNPAYFDTYSRFGADLTLSGHIHGGMIRIPFLGGVYSPEKTFFPKYDAGLYSVMDKKMIVSRGLGNGKQGFRFLNPPEIVTITLKTL